MNDQHSAFGNFSWKSLLGTEIELPLEILFRKLESRASAEAIDHLPLEPLAKARLQSAWTFTQRYLEHRERQKIQVKKSKSLHSLHSDPSGDPFLPLDIAVLDHVPEKLRLDTHEWIGFIPAKKNKNGLEFSAIQIVDKGARTHVNTDSKEFFFNLLISGSDAFILVHNHPSGMLRPSSADFELTQKVEGLASLLGIEALGHCIVHGSEHHWIVNPPFSLLKPQKSPRKRNRPQDFPLPH